MCCDVHYHTEWHFGIDSNEVVRVGRRRRRRRRGVTRSNQAPCGANGDRQKRREKKRGRQKTMLRWVLACQLMHASRGNAGVAGVILVMP
jgi:hypothetical protein